MIVLFHVTSTVKEFGGCKDVPFFWFRNGPAHDRPYHELIRDYQPGDDYPELFVDELFDREEANALKEYLDRRDIGITTIKQVELPIANDVMAISALAVGGADDFYMLDKSEDYPLTFSVWGYFNLLGCQLADGSGVYRHRLWVMFSDGTFRQQTNEEAAQSERDRRT